MKLSIITINYNNAAGLCKTVQSVAEQLPCDLEVEHIIVDGNSTDESVQIIREYEQQLSSSSISLTWVSESDNGIYNAMNKGIRMASGEYIQILNSGDILASNHVLADCCMHMDKLGHPKFLYGNMIKKDYTTGKIVGKSGEVPYSLLQYFVSTMNHDCCWIKRSLFVNVNANDNANDNDNIVGVDVGVCKSYGLYDEDLRIVSDWKWFLQAIGLGKVKPVYVDVDMTIFDTSGISEQNLSLRYEERRRVLEDVLPPAVLADYDRHAFDMEQMDNLRKHPWAYKLVWTLERVLNRIDNKNFKKPKTV
ncbi:MAG: glycosyltransferase family 2 protein [Paludibacteraceae bacterium]